MPERTPVTDANAQQPDPLSADRFFAGPGADALNDDTSDTTTIDAMLDQLANEQNVWELIERVESQCRTPAERQRYYERFITMVALRPQAEQDALIARGHSVFRYRTDTARRDVQALRQASGNAIKIAPSCSDETMMAEIIHCPNDPTPIKYLVYKLDGTTEVAERVEIGTFIYMPPQSMLVEQGFLKLATGVEEYGSDDDLFRDVFGFIGRHVLLLDRSFKKLVTLYIMFGWLFDKFDITPYLRVIGDADRGKSRFLQVVGSLGFRALIANGAATVASLMRAIDRFQGLTVLDEADIRERSEMYDDMMKLLNLGYDRRQGVVWRCSENPAPGQQRQEIAFRVYGPKLISTRERFKDHAAESRCITGRLPDISVTKLKQAGIPLDLGRSDFDAAAQVMRNKLLLFRFRHWRDARSDSPDYFEGIDTRINQILGPLLTIASPTMRADIHTLAQAQQEQLRQAREERPEGKIAFALLSAWKRRTDEDRVALAAVTERLEQAHPDLKANSWKVGVTIRDTFTLKTRNIGGKMFVAMYEFQARDLAGRYGYAFEQFLPTPSVAEVREAVGAPRP